MIETISSARSDAKILSLFCYLVKRIIVLESYVEEVQKDFYWRQHHVAADPEWNMREREK